MDETPSEYVKRFEEELAKVSKAAIKESEGEDVVLAEERMESLEGRTNSNWVRIQTLEATVARIDNYLKADTNGE
jgi:wyosine [tRNA(Phe)-imidazoG37] synthetase (radical SAM superfamily)